MLSHASLHLPLRLVETKRYVALIIVLQTCVFALAGVSAFLLRFDGHVPSGQLVNLWYALPVWLIVKSAGLQLAGLHRSGWRYFSVPDAQRLVATLLAASTLSIPIVLSISPPGFPRSLYVLDFVLSVCYSGTVRLVVRAAFEAPNGVSASKGERTFIYGGGYAGVLLIRETHINSSMNCQVCGIIDDNPRLNGTTLLGVKVLGGGPQLAELATRYRVTGVIIAAPSATPAEMVKMLGRCAEARLKVRMMPRLPDVMQRQGLANNIREVSVEDLLGRKPVKLDVEGIRTILAGEVVLVTGAAGSIGSELCRQIARFSPKAIIGVDCSETALFYIDREMKGSFPTVHFEPAIANIRDTLRLDEILHRHHPSILYHAAAYKHVPLMERHVFEAVENNVLGTYAVARAAGKFGIREFVMISSDKAVRPTSVMGLTKRIAEILVASFRERDTVYVSVRFGNVLGSNGSVVPVFKEQIARGGPVTVTHPEMRRFFMTIPEAVQLVLQASLMGRGGEVFVLDMGEPVKIVDLARNLILLSGLRPNEDVRIEFTSIRPGEKLYEELNTDDEHTLPTSHDKIRIFSGNGTQIGDPGEFASRITKMCANRDYRLLLLMKDLVPDYNPSADILRDAISEPPKMREAPGSSLEHVRRAVVGAST